MSRSSGKKIRRKGRRGRREKILWSGRGRLEEGKKGPRTSVGFVWLWPSKSTAASATTGSRLSLVLALGECTHQSQSAVLFAFHVVSSSSFQSPSFIMTSHAPSVRLLLSFSGLSVATSVLISPPRLCVNIHIKECVCVVLSHKPCLSHVAQQRIITCLLHVTAHVVPLFLLRLHASLCLPLCNFLPYLNHRELGRWPASL